MFDFISKLLSLLRPNNTQQLIFTESVPNNHPRFEFLNSAPYLADISCPC